MKLPYEDDRNISDKWDTATELLQQEFNIAPERVHLLGTIKTLFTKYVGENDLSEEAAHALYYRLVFFSTLMMSPASLKLPFSVAWVTWEMVLYFPESKWPA